MSEKKLTANEKQQRALDLVQSILGAIQVVTAGYGEPGNAVTVVCPMDGPAETLERLIPAFARQDTTAWFGVATAKEARRAVEVIKPTALRMFDESTAGLLPSGTPILYFGPDGECAVLGTVPLRHAGDA
jgi:hypothetical protein